jgi:Uma2 family endonuclease
MSAVASNPPAAQERPKTVEDYLALPDSKGWELDDGRLVEKPMGSNSTAVGTELLFLIFSYLRDHPIGKAYAEMAYRCYPNHPNRVRKPDVSFIRNGRLPAGPLLEPGIPVAPDWAVEVLSPNDLASEINRKVREYLEAGVRLVWIIDPETRTILIRRLDGTIAQADERGTVSGEDVLPGFQFVVGDLFKPTV